MTLIKCIMTDKEYGHEHRLLNMPPECDDDGSTEYKYHLVNLTDKQKQHLASQMTWRLSTECGQAIYEIGLTDDGFPAGLTEDELRISMESLKEVADIADSVIICGIEKIPVTHYADSEQELVSTLITNRSKVMHESMSNVDAKWKYVNDAKKRGAQAFTRYIAEVIIRRDMGGYWETKCGIAGNVDCGKSTLLGVLTTGKWDNGRGSARLSTMSLDHEIASGRTSSVNQQIVGFNDEGSLVNEILAKKSHTSGRLEWADIIKSSNKIVTFFDLAGHLKYLSQTIKGLSSNELDYVLIIVGANMSESVSAEGTKTGAKNKWINMTREHMQLSLVLGMRCIVVVTKIDLVEDEIKQRTLRGIKRLVKRDFAPYSLDTMDNVKTCVKLMNTGNVIPIVQVSNVTGEGHDILRKLLYYLPPRREYESKFKNPPIMQIQDIFRQVEGTSTIIAGMLTSGEIHTGQAAKGTALKIGPLSDGTFIDARVRTIHCKRMDVQSVSAGKYVCLGLPKAVDGSKIRKNMFAVGVGLNPKATWEFWADIKLNSVESMCIRPGYTPHCYIGHIRQTCKILRIIDIPNDNTEDEVWQSSPDIDSLATGAEARVLMRFCFRPELIFNEDRKKLVFKEAKTKGVGSVIQTTDTVHVALDNKMVTKDGKCRPTRRQRKELRARRSVVMPVKPASATINVKSGKMTI